LSETTAVTTARGASYLGIQSLVSLSAQTVALGILARMITVTEMGLLTILTAVLAAAQVVVNLGLGAIMPKLVAENAAQGKIGISAAIFYTSFFLNALVSVVVAAVILVSRFPTGISGLSGSAISVLLALDILVNYTNITGAAFGGLQKFRDLAVFTSVFTITKQTLILYLVFLFRTLVGWIAALTITDLASTIVMSAYLMKQLGRPVFELSAKDLLKLSAPLFLSNVLLFGYNWFDRLFLIGFVDLTALGLYGAATQAFSAYLGVVGVLPMVLLPAFARTHGVGGRDSLHYAVKSASRYICYTVIPVAFVLLAAARPAITLFLGRRYEGAGLPLGELGGFSIATVLAYPFNSVLIVLNETGLYALTVIIPLLLSVIIAFSTISSLGIVAASTARGLAMVLNLVLSIVLLRRKLPVTLDINAVVKSITAGAAMALVIWLMQVVWYDALLLPLYLLCGGATYLILLRVLKAVNMEDMDLARRVLGPRFGFLLRLLSRILLS
jgi:O-antigen/teichoic acid export membrane protein